MYNFQLSCSFMLVDLNESLLEKSEVNVINPHLLAVFHCCHLDVVHLASLLDKQVSRIRLQSWSHGALYPPFLPSSCVWVNFNQGFPSQANSAFSVRRLACGGWVFMWIKKWNPSFLTNFTYETTSSSNCFPTGCKIAYPSYTVWLASRLEAHLWLL